jgi:pSer/pThr/pTyr-binding forkhead associated (FHA) protein
MSMEKGSNAYLVIQQGPMGGKRVELWKDCTTIGRSRDCDIFLEDLAVHRKQASILQTPTGYILRDDHGSSDGLVNGKPVVVEQLLNSGDQLLFGTTQMTFFASEGTRPFKLPSSRGRELHLGKSPHTQSSVIALLELSNSSTGDRARSIELLPHMTIGRSRTSSIFLEDLAVSRHHATIREVSSGEYELLDNHSATGTFVNGQPITSHLLHEGDVIQIGSNKFVFRHASS